MQHQTKRAEAGLDPLVCTHGNCKKLQTGESEFCDRHETKHDPRTCENSKPCFDCEYPLESQAEQEQADEILEHIGDLVKDGFTSGNEANYSWTLTINHK